MIGSPLEGSWDKATDAAYYTGLGSGELIWLVVSIALCLLACVVGHRHESKINAE